MVSSIKFHVSAAKCTSGKQGERCKTGFKNTTEIYDLLVRKPPQFRSTLTKRGIFLFGKKLSLLIVTLTGTHVGSKRLSI